MTIAGVRYAVTPPLEFTVTFDREDGLYDLSGDLDILLTAETRTDLLEVVEATLVMLWQDYALEEPDRLTPAARRLREKLLDRFRPLS